VGVKKFKSVGIPRTKEDTAIQRREESKKRVKQTYWALKRSDELLVKANRIIESAQERLRKHTPLD